MRKQGQQHGQVLTSTQLNCICAHRHSIFSRMTQALHGAVTSLWGIPAWVFPELQVLGQQVRAQLIEVAQQRRRARPALRCTNNIGSVFMAGVRALRGLQSSAAPCRKPWAAEGYSTRSALSLRLRCATRLFPVWLTGAPGPTALMSLAVLDDSTHG